MELKNFKRLDKGCLISTFTVLIPEWGNMEIDCKYFEKGTSSWMSFASKEYESEGKKKSWDQVRWPTTVKDKLTQTIKTKMAQTTSDHIQDSDEIPF